MKKIIFVCLFASLLLAGCSSPQPVETTEATLTTSSEMIQTEATTKEITIPKEETTAPINIAEDEKYVFSSAPKVENNCYFTLEYEEEQIKSISFFVPSDGEMERAWFFGFSERTDFLFVRRTDRKTGGFRMMYVYETMREREQDGILYHDFRASTARIGFLPDYTPLVYSENPANIEILYHDGNKERMLSQVKNSYQHFRSVTNDNFQFDRETYQYDILYGYVDGVEYIMETDVETLPELPFSVLSEYGADEIW